MEETEMIKTAAEAGFTFSPQALTMLSQLSSQEENLNALIELAKQRKWVIAGGDVLKFIICRELPTSLRDAEDFGKVKVNTNG